MHNLEGTWHVTIKSMMGEERSVNKYTVTGDVLTGTVTDVKTGNVAEVTDGKVNGNDFSFKIIMKLPFGKMPFTMKGSVSENGEMTGEASMPMGVSAFRGTKE